MQFKIAKPVKITPERVEYCIYNTNHQNKNAAQW